MGGRDHLVERKERVCPCRLLFEHVERGTGHVAALDGALQVGLHDEPAARAVHDAHTRPGLGESISVDDPPRLVRQRHVQG